MPKSVVSTLWKLARRCLPLGLIGPNAQISLTKTSSPNKGVNTWFLLKGSICNLSRSTQATGIKKRGVRPRVRYRIEKNAFHSFSHAFLRYVNRGPECISARPSTKEWIKVIECYQKTLGFFIEKVLFFLRQRISFIKFLFDLPLLEHHNIRPCPFEVNALNVESIIRYPFPYHRTEWKKSNETCDGY